MTMSLLYIPSYHSPSCFTSTLLYDGSDPLSQRYGLEKHCWTRDQCDIMAISKLCNGAQSRVVPSVSWLPLFGAPLMYLQ